MFEFLVFFTSMNRLGLIHVNNDGKSSPHIETLEIFVLLLGLGVPLEHKTLHQTISLVDPLFNQFLDGKLINQLILQERFLNLPSRNGVLSDLVTYQRH